MTSCGLHDFPGTDESTTSTTIQTTFREGCRSQRRLHRLAGPPDLLPSLQFLATLIAQVHERRTSPSPIPMTSIQPDHYADDAPIHSQAEDRFSRWAFAERSATVIATRKDSSSLVVGIYGPWGDGKTSVLNLMEVALNAHEDVVTIRFNPWHFESEGQLIRAFFDTLADAAGRKLATRGEQIGTALKKYGGLLSVASMSFGGIGVSPADGVKDLGEQLSSVKLDELKDRLGSLLTDSGKRIVVLIDDVDRLDRAEVHGLLKLIKLSASFANTAYVVACDDEVVAASLGERYGAGGIAAGRQFLEKIIQVPLHLPNAEADDLRQLAFEGVDDVLQQNAMSPAEGDVEAFVRHFSLGILPALNTPRQVKRYVNAIRFSVPLLKGEVCATDQLLLEAVRIVYPPLYLKIRENQETYVGRSASGFGGEVDKDKTQAAVRSHIEELPSTDREAARGVVEALFPRTKNASYGSDWESVWSEGQRLASNDYFRRYFQYSVPKRDIADGFLHRLFETAANGDSEGTDEALAEITDRKAWGRALDKLFSGSEGVSDTAKLTLATAFARHSERLPAERGPFSALFSTMSRSAILVARLLRQVSDTGLRVAGAKAVITEAGSLGFAADCLRWLQVEPKDEPDLRPFSPGELEELGGELAARVSEAVTKENGMASLGSDLGHLLWVWTKHGGAGHVTEFLLDRFSKDPNDALRFLAVFVGRGWGLEDGLSRAGDFERHSYDAVANLIDPELIMVPVRSLYGDRVDTFSFDQRYQLKGDDRIVCGFVAIHNHVVGEIQEKTLAEGDSTSASG